MGAKRELANVNEGGRVRTEAGEQRQQQQQQRVLPAPFIFFYFFHLSSNYNFYSVGMHDTAGFVRHQQTQGQ
jgi:hypothetical protein